MSFVIRSNKVGYFSQLINGQDHDLSPSHSHATWSHDIQGAHHFTDLDEAKDKAEDYLELDVEIIDEASGETFRLIETATSIVWTGTSQAEGPSRPQTPPTKEELETIEQIREMARRIVESYGPVTGAPDRFGFNEESVKWLDGYIEEIRNDPENYLKELEPAYVAFLGECLIAKYGGEWRNVDGAWMVVMDKYNLMFHPSNKVSKQIKGIRGHSIYHFYMNGLDANQVIRDEVMKDFKNYPKVTAEVEKQLAANKDMLVVLGAGWAVAIGMDSQGRRDPHQTILDFLRDNPQYELPKDEDDIKRVAFLFWKKGSTIDNPTDAATISIAEPGQEIPMTLPNGKKVGIIIQE